jgi:xanthine dehydrogenase accessory factor
MVAAEPAAGAWLEPLHGHWVAAALAGLPRQGTLVRVTVARQRGSAPREAGATLLVGGGGFIGTIGGGQLEWHAVAAAQKMLEHPNAAPLRIDDVILGPHRAQCCGGRVELWIERLTRADLPWLEAAGRHLDGACAGRGPLALATESAGRVVNHRLLRRPADASPVLRREEGRITLIENLGVRRPPVWIFGAGHVGQALVRLLSQVGLFQIDWIDPRPALLPPDLPRVTARACTAPTSLLTDAAADTRHVVLTHDHALDYELCRSILERGAFSWLGLIGSASKATSFRSRLARDGIAPQVLARLTCPIGIDGVSSKVPAAIAIAIAAQLLKLDSVEPRDEARSAVLCSGECETCGSTDSRDRAAHE